MEQTETMRLCETVKNKSKLIADQLAAVQKSKDDKDAFEKEKQRLLDMMGDIASYVAMANKRLLE